MIVRPYLAAGIVVLLSCLLTAGLGTVALAVEHDTADWSTIWGVVGGRIVLAMRPAVQRNRFVFVESWSVNLDPSVADSSKTQPFGRPVWDFAPGQYRVELPLVWIPVLAGFAGMGPCWWIGVRGRRRIGRNRCHVCGYDLRGTPQRCPECA